MVLNEQSGKIDAALESTCKKFEKVALETGNLELKELEFNTGDQKSKFISFILYTASFDFYFSIIPWLHKDIYLVIEQV